ncbi:hypothetical protein V6N11_036299 [Hibiscus sabdariffa]|uniref:Uncharacterized protein n=1 Tax=Hibiscus sabdariffa TaxID=183260 RepID=A0ABR2RAF4_9ROSI
MGQAGGIMDAVRVEGESRDQVDETIPVEKVGNTSSGAAAGTMPMRAGSIRRVDIGNGAGSSVAPRQIGGVENDKMRVVEELGQGDMVDFVARGLVVGAKTTLDFDSKGRLVSECNSNEVPRPVSVSTMVNGESWDWNRLQGWLPLPILEKLEACPISKTSFGDDVPGWRWTENRCFTVGSAYEHLVTEEARNVGEGRVRIGECGLLFGVGYYGNCDAP